MQDLSKISVVLPSLDPDEKLIAVVDDTVHVADKAFFCQKLFHKETSLCSFFILFQSYIEEP